MSDIVPRLRDSATQARALDRAALLNEAADEIVKIRRQVADLRGTPQAHATPREYSEPREGTVRLTLTDADAGLLQRLVLSAWFLQRRMI